MMDLNNYKTDYVSAFGPPQSSSGVQSTQPQSQYGFNQQQQTAQPQGPMGAAPPLFMITPEHFKPYETKCPHCHSQITTEITFFIGGQAKECVFVMLISFIWVGLFCFAFLPCCMKMFKDVRHTCPNCRRTVADYERGDIAPHLKSPYMRPKGYQPRQEIIQGHIAMQSHKLAQKYMLNQHEPKPGVLFVQKTWITTVHFSPYETTCPHCHAQITTVRTYHTGRQTYFCSFVLIIIFIWFGFLCVLCIPFFMDDYKDATHTCPRCHKIVAVYERHELVG